MQLNYYNYSHSHYYYHYYFYCTLLLLISISSQCKYANCYREDATAPASDQVHSSAVSQVNAKSARFNFDPTGYFAPNSLHNKYNNKLTFNEYVSFAGRSLAMVAGFDNDLHRYDNKQNLVDSFERNQTASSASSSASLSDYIGYHLADARYETSEFELLHDQTDATLAENELNQVKCAKQVDFLYEQLQKLLKDYSAYTQSKRLDLIDLFDSYGQAPSEQLMMGNTVWLGSFEQCQRASVQMSMRPAAASKNEQSDNNNNNNIAGRYCVAHLRLPDRSRVSSLSAQSAAAAAASPSLVNSANLSTITGGDDDKGGGSGGDDDDDTDADSSEIEKFKASNSGGGVGGGLGGASIKLGVCLPRACNSISILRHSERIETLIKLARLQQVPYSSAQLTQLYCLPDENSPLRQLSLSAKLFIVFVSCWLALVVCVSLKCEYAKARLAANQRWRRQRRRELDNSDSCNAGAAGAASEATLLASDQAAHLLIKSSSSSNKLEQIFDFRHAWQQLFSSEEPVVGGAMVVPSSKLNGGAGIVMRENLRDLVKVELAKQSSVTMKMHTGALAEPIAMPSDQVNCNKLNSSSSGGSNHSCCAHQFNLLATSHHPRTVQMGEPSGDVVKSAGQSFASEQQLSAIDGIKVLSMIWLISAHTLLLFVRNITNGRDFWSILLDARFMTVMAGIFPVDSFFTITGVLTSYLKFNKCLRSQQARHSLTTINYWLEIFVHRYLRFMPMYLLIFWYSRDVSEYIGHGPMWDYATASTSLRSMCKRESIAVPLLFQANFKPIDQHCIKPAWYLANDYQYLLISPLFILLLLLSKWLGYLTLGLGIVASLVAQFLTVYYPTVEDNASGANGGPTTFTDFEAVANFKPMFAAYLLKDLWRLYGLPYNRIAPYLIGLLTGHLMYSHNKHNNSGSSSSSSGSSNSCDKASLSSQQLASPTTPSQSDLSVSSHASTESLTLSANSVGQQSNNCKDTDHHHHHDKEVCAEQSQQEPIRLSASIASKHNGLETKTTPTAAAAATTTTTGPQSHKIPQIAVLLMVVYSPLMTTLLEPLAGEQARVCASLLIAVLRFAWSLAIARLVYVCFISNSTTKKPLDKRLDGGSFVMDFLSSPKWKPWSKIGLSVLLIQWEVIHYFVQTQNNTPYMSFSFLFTAMIACIVASYALGLLIYLIFEYPLSQIERIYIKSELFSKK